MEAMIVTLMRIAPTLTAPIAAPVRKDTLEKESRAKVKLDSPQIIASLSNKLVKIFFS